MKTDIGSPETAQEKTAPLNLRSHLARALPGLITATALIAALWCIYRLAIGIALRLTS